MARNLLFPDVVNWNLADKLTAPHGGGKMPPLCWPASLGPAGRACFKSWERQLMNPRSQEQQRKPPLPTAAALISNGPGWVGSFMVFFLMKSSDWTMDDGKLCVGSWQVQRGENKSKQWKV